MRAHDGSQADRLAAVVDHAMDLFWAAIADEYREATTGDLDPAEAHAFHAAAQRVAEAWVSANVPTCRADAEDL